MQLGLGVVPLLVDDELLQAREEADLRKDPTKLLKRMESCRYIKNNAVAVKG